MRGRREGALQSERGRRLSAHSSRRLHGQEDLPFNFHPRPAGLHLGRPAPGDSLRAQAAARQDARKAGRYPGIPRAPTAVDAGYWEGRTLPEMQEELGEDLVGAHGAWALHRNKFPLLVKLLDANENLSIQVHPDDTYARQYEGRRTGQDRNVVCAARRAKHRGDSRLTPRHHRQQFSRRPRRRRP